MQLELTVLDLSQSLPSQGAGKVVYGFGKDPGAKANQNRVRC